MNKNNSVVIVRDEEVWREVGRGGIGRISGDGWRW